MEEQKNKSENDQKLMDWRLGQLVLKEIDEKEKTGPPGTPGSELEENKVMKGIKGYDHKTAPKPEKYNGNYQEYNSWHELFMAMMVAQA